MSQPFRILHDTSLRTRNTFGVEAIARTLVEVSDAEHLPEVYADADVGAAPMILGGGSNLLFAGDPEGALIALSGRRMSVVEDDGDTVLVRAEAGAPWHPFVQWTLAQGLSGLQNLSLIPGTVGAAPIQNIGAYGVEVCDSIDAVTAYAPATGQSTRMQREDCRFAYRDSIFKHQPDALVVTSVDFRLTRDPAVRLDYSGIGDELAAMGVTAPTPRQVADAVVRIRRRKLPDPAKVGNAGSFFKNPIVPLAQAQALLLAHPAAPVFGGGSEDTRKVSAAWLIDQCGWKGHREADAGVSDQHALVLVNHGAASGAQLLALARRIAASVQARFGVAIEPEPRLIGARWQA